MFARAAAVTNPVEDGTGDIGFFLDEVVGSGEAVYIGVRQTLLEVVQVQIGKHWVVWAPEQRNWYRRQVGKSGRDAVESAGRGVLGFERDVGHEVGDGVTTFGAAVRSQVTIANCSRWAWSTHVDCTANERR